MRQKFRHQLVDMYNMVGYSPAAILKEKTPYCSRNLVDASDTELLHLQGRLVNFVSKDVWGLTSENAGGMLLNSGSESNEIAIYLAKLKTKKRIVVASSLCHSSIEQACKKLDMQLIKIPVEKDTFIVSDELLQSTLSKNIEDIALISITAGTTLLGSRADIDIDTQTKDFIKDKNIWLHIDAAYGGMILGLSNDRPIANEYESANSITIDLHKFIGPLGCSVLVLSDVRDRLLLGDEARYFESVGTQLGTSRGAYPSAVTMAIIDKYHKSGLKKMAVDCINKSAYAARLLQSKDFTLISKITTGVVPILLQNELEVAHYKQQLERIGYKVSSVHIDTQQAKIYGIRIVVTPKKIMTQDLLRRFVLDIAKVRDQQFNSR